MHVVATAGHVDHGKSALLQRLTGMEPDRWAEERRRGLTIDLGYVWTQLPTPDGDTTTVAFVDVPGHDQFIPNMLSGVGVVQQVLLVVAADDGWSAQSEEHLAIVELLGLRVALAVVTKADLAGAARADEVAAQVGARLGAAASNAPVVVADSVSGRGLDEVAAALVRRLASSADEGGPDRDARLWVDRAFTVTGAGTVVTGMLDSGRLAVGQRVAVLPGGARARIRGLQSLGQQVETAAAGSRVAVNLAGVSHEAVGRGMALVEVEGGEVQGLASSRLDVELRALPGASIGARGAWHLHLGTGATTVRVRPLLGDLEPGATGPARLELAEPLPARHGDRIVLRDAGRRATAGGGVVLDPDPAPRPRGSDGRLAHALVLEDLVAAEGPDARLRGLVEAHDGVRERASLRAATGRAVGDPGDGERDGGDLEAVGGHLVEAGRLARWIEAAATAARDTADDRHPVPTAQLTAALAAQACPNHLVDAVLAAAEARGRLVSVGGRHLHPDLREAYLAARGQRQAAFRDRLEAAACDPPDPGALAEEVGIPAYEVQALIDAGEVIACGSLLFGADAVRAAVAALRQGPGRDGAAFSASDARRAWGTTRRAAVPLLEHLAATRVSVFDGTHHRLRETTEEAG